MDIDAKKFRQSLVHILKDISEAKIVTFDLEMSGINTKPKSTGDRSTITGKPTLQQLYEDVKSAAETYQVLQLGITCVSEDRDKEYYLAKPYNFTLSPLTMDACKFGPTGSRLSLDRNFTFSGNTAEFLAKHGFDFGRVFTDGVHYLSQDEEVELIEEYDERWNKMAKMADVTLAPDDHANMEFYRSARNTISAWINDLETKDDFVNISGPAETLSGLQRRLVHQLVRNEFAGFRGTVRGNNTFMQVTKVNPTHEQDYQARSRVTYQKNIAKQIGLRWVFEALCGGDLSGIDVQWLTEYLNINEAKAVEEELNNVIKTLSKKKLIIVGHNQFYDFAFLYKTFVGSLPNDVKHFQAKINELFPFMVDTKYMATHGPGADIGRSSLNDCLEPFRMRQKPLIVLHEDHTSYGGDVGRQHEAGYDSWMTAELFVKLAAKLSLERKDNGISESESSGSECTTPEEYLGEHQDSAGGAAVSPDMIDLGDGRFFFGDKPKNEQWIPRMSSKFWTNYVNKLRVNGSDVGVCDLAGR